jgi:hypothetical protein
MVIKAIAEVKAEIRRVKAGKIVGYIKVDRLLLKAGAEFCNILSGD